MSRYRTAVATTCLVLALAAALAEAGPPSPVPAGDRSHLRPSGYGGRAGDLSYRRLGETPPRETGETPVLRGARPPARELHQDITRILAQPDYQQPDMTWLDKVLAGLTQWLRRVFGYWGASFAKLHEAWPLLYWVIVALLVVALALVLYHIFWTLTTAFGRRRRPAEATIVREDAAPDELRKLAMRLAAQGKFGEALAALHAALIRLLDQRGVLRHDRARTNWEYLDALRGRPELLEVMQPLTASLDPVLYGGEGLGEAEYRACEALVGRAWTSGEAGG